LAEFAGERVIPGGVDPMKRVVEVTKAHLSEYAWTRRAYADAGAPARFRVLRCEPEVALADQYLSALN